MKNFLFWIWLAVCILGVFLLNGLATADKNYTGTDITFTTSESNLVIISAGEITIAAASDDFFVLRNGSETMIGVLTQKPLGWSGSYFTTVEPIRISNGTWEVEKGTNITVQLNSPETMTVRESLKTVDKGGLAFASALIGVLIWLLGLLLGSTSPWY